MSVKDFEKFLENIRAGKYTSPENPFYQGMLRRCEGDQTREAIAALESYLRSLAPAAGPPPPPDIKNPDFEWLTYESLFNKDKFKKPNQAFELGLYLIPLSSVNLYVRDHIDRQTLENLQAAFFPKGIDARDIVVLSQMHCSGWKQSNEQMSFKDERYIVLPYNYWDNTLTSNALGTNTAFYPLAKLQATWPAWKTASRTCVVRTKGVDVQTRAADYAWPFAEGERVRQEPFSSHSSHYKLAGYQAMDFSVKTGVQYVGRDDQRNAAKDVVDGWRIGALRSDYVAAVDAEMQERVRNKRNAQLPADLIVLTELLGITEKKQREGLKDFDGMLVRDLSPLDKRKVYIPPTALPFIDLHTFDQLQSEFAALATDVWQQVGKQAWATALGRAKALFLLRYGLQHINPNPQNYLIEWERTKAAPPLQPTGRIVIRDLNDAALVREVVWALYGPGGPPPEGDANAKELARLNKPLFRYEFTQLLAECQETGSTNIQFGPPGVQLLWQRFSAYTNGEKIAPQRKEYEQVDWKLLLGVMADWGAAHNRAYIECIEGQLGVKLAGVAWDKLPPLDAYRGFANDLAAFRRSDEIKWEESAAKVIQAFLQSPTGQQKLRDYRDNLWQPLA